MEEEKDAIIVASFGTFSTGINIRNLHNIIFASPSKSRIRNLQSIGRGLRKGAGKEKAVLFDIADDLRVGKHMNFTLRHFVERTKIYNDEGFPYKLYKIGLKNGTN
jgi:superfamily II DNA or RNA helicase